MVYKPITAGFTQCFTQKKPNQATIKLSAMCVLVQRERMAEGSECKEERGKMPTWGSKSMKFAAGLPHRTQQNESLQPLQ